ncbi:magu-3 [Pristionchus pacificus]|uniref:Magu-3 n=1 Tax=Pristionchus pacificus TaxID=54126 RepID=A0A2A6C4S7_PRIPA|nr:magu-3 [Pristionchus pacificus]|eukprot:PDM73031.1 magu-3 [Pristionchus pacificus]
MSEDELNQLRANADSLAGCLHSLLQKIETMEKGKGEKEQRSGAESPLTIQTDAQESVTEIRSDKGVKRIITRQTVKTRSIHAVNLDSSLSLLSSQHSPNHLPPARDVTMQAKQLQLLRVSVYQSRLIVLSVEPKTNLDIQAGDIIREVDGRVLFSDSQLRALSGQITLTVQPAQVYEAPPKFFRLVNPYEDRDSQFSVKGGEVIQVLSEEADKLTVRSVHDPTVVGRIPMTIESESVTMMSPFGRGVVALVGAQAVGRRTIKTLLLQYAPHLFATAVPVTSREPRNGEQEGREYQFWRKETVLQRIRDHEMIEWGELDNQLYGTWAGDIKEVIESGRVCIFDCSPQALPYLYNSSFKPFVVHIRGPELEESVQLEQLRPKIRSKDELEKADKDSDHIASNYGKYIHLTLINRNTDVTFKKLLSALEDLRSNSQYIPIGWSELSSAGSYKNDIKA